VSQQQTLMARDGHTFNAYFADPPGRARGAVVIVQEIFGLTSFVRRTTDSYAADGYVAIAPALFDRVRRDVVLGYSGPEVEQAMGYRLQIPVATALLDVAAAASVVRHAGRVAVIGFCWGGTIAWAAAGSMTLSAAVSYYGARLLEQSRKMPSCPTLLHFGDQDASIPASEVQQVRDAYPAGEVHVYAAGHAFANEDRPDRYNAEAAALARTRTNQFLQQHVG